MPWPGERGARYLYMLARDACSECDDLPTRVEAGLRAVLEALADDPELAYELTVGPHLDADDKALSAQREWIRRFARLLQSATAGEPGSSFTDRSLLTPFLIDGVRFQVGRLVIAEESDDLLRLLPGLLETLLAYFGSSERVGVGQACLRRI